MVQDYLASIDTVGEVDLIFFDGVFSHAVKKKPALTVGEGIIERPWERMAWDGQVVPDHKQLAIGYSTLAVIRKRFGRSPVYGRVDLVPSSTGDPLLLEVELIDPYLSLDMVPTAAARLAVAVLASGAESSIDKTCQ
jgi:O-ureido-D-serine cyclo-ligase